MISRLGACARAQIPILRISQRFTSPSISRHAIRQFQTSVSRASKPNATKPIAKPVAAAPIPAGRKPLFPTRLLIYHCGTFRTVFTGCLKVTTIFLFGFFSFIVAPAQLNASEDEPLPPAARVGLTLLAGVIPLLIVTHLTRPVVAYVHLVLPAYARASREILQRYLRTLPPDAAIDITTITLIGRPRVQRLKISELTPKKPGWLNVANFHRTTEDTTRPWWAGKGIRQFSIQDNKEKSCREGWAWEVVAGKIRERGV